MVLPTQVSAICKSSSYMIVTHAPDVLMSLVDLELAYLSIPGEASSMAWFASSNAVEEPETESTLAVLPEFSGSVSVL